MAFWITSHMRTKRKRVDDKLMVIKLFAVIIQRSIHHTVFKMSINHDLYIPMQYKISYLLINANQILLHYTTKSIFIKFFSFLFITEYK